MTTEQAPLVLTLKLDEDSFQFFDRMRQQHFPAARNFIQAHLTLFHHLPGEERAAIVSRLEDTGRQQPPMPLQVTAVKMTGRGVAYVLESQALKSLHQQLLRLWRAWLTPQDRQGIWPHITIQNKVPPEEARALQQRLSEDFMPFSVLGTGLQLWRYEGGPWTLLHGFPFQGRND